MEKARISGNIGRGSGEGRGTAPLEYLYGGHPWPIVYILYRHTYIFCVFQLALGHPYRSSAQCGKRTRKGETPTLTEMRDGGL